MIAGHHWTYWLTIALVGWALLAAFYGTRLRWLVWKSTIVVARPASLALVFGWLAAQLWWRFTGDQTPEYVYLPCDIAVILVILAARTTMLDVPILGLFLLEWAVYAKAPDELTEWWALFGLTSLQLLLAGPWIARQRASGSVSHGSLKEQRYGGT